MSSSDPTGEIFLDMPSSQSTEKRKGLPRVVLISLVGFIVIIATWFVPFGQRGNLRAAQRHAELIRPKVQADSRFQKVKVQTHTAKGGCLYIGGIVKSTGDAEALRVFVASTKPPVKTWFMVFISTEDPYKPEVAHLPDLLPGGV